MAQMLAEQYRERLVGVLSCYDRIVITGTLPRACYAVGMTSFLYSRGIRIFDYARFAEPLRDRIRTAGGGIGEHSGRDHPAHQQAGPTFARKTWSPRCSPSAVIIRGWCT